MAIKLDLPEPYRGTYHLTWFSENGKTIDEVGLVYELDGGTHTETWEVDGGVEKAQNVITKKVIPFLRETYHLDGEGAATLPPPPPPPVVAPSPDFTKVAKGRGDRLQENV